MRGHTLHLDEILTSPRYLPPAGLRGTRLLPAVVCRGEAVLFPVSCVSLKAQAQKSLRRPRLSRTWGTLQT